MLMIRKIIQKDHHSFHKFCTGVGTKEKLSGPVIYWGAFDNNKLLGYAKINFHALEFPLIEDLKTDELLENSIVEGLLRGTLHYCFTQNYHRVAFKNLNWINNYLKSALEMIEKKSSNNICFYEMNIPSFFEKPCKGRSM